MLTPCFDCKLRGVVNLFSPQGMGLDKRAHHNALERKRRDHIKDSFTNLRDCIPAMSGEKVRCIIIIIMIMS